MLEALVSYLGIALLTNVGLVVANLREYRHNTLIGLLKLTFFMFLWSLAWPLLLAGAIYSALQVSREEPL